MYSQHTICAPRCYEVFQSLHRQFVHSTTVGPTSATDIQ